MLPRSLPLALVIATVLFRPVPVVAAGAISGTVTNAANASPIQNVTVQIYSSIGALVSSTSTDATGNYVVSGLTPGTYFARTSNALGYVDELFGGKFCIGGFCSVTTGTPIVVADGATTTDINFALAEGGAITGTVTAVAGGAPIEGITMALYDSDGKSIAGVDETDASGIYSLQLLPPGNYFLRTSSQGFSDQPFLNYVDELYDDITCPGGSCTITSGTPISVTAGATTSGIDFALAGGGRIFGTVTVNGGSANGADVDIYNSSGVFVAYYHFSSSFDEYSVPGLPTGNYFAVARQFGYVEKLYDNIVCLPLSCPITTGTPIAVTAGFSTFNIDFTLDPGGTITGTVTSASGGSAISGVTVLIHNASGDLVASGNTGATGVYTAAGLPAGNYFVKTSNSAGFLDQLHSGLPCEPSCTVTTGTPVVVAAGATTGGINFALVPQTVTVTPATLNFAGTNTGGTLDPITPPQTVTVAFAGVSGAAWAATANEPWVQLTGASGNGSGSFTVAITNPGGILPTNVLNGQVSLSATVTVTAAGVSNSPKTITVNLSLQPGATFAPPIGLVDTPLQNASGQVGAIGVTGWVVDDVGIANVQVYRNCLAFEPAINCQLINGHNVVFIGNATLVPGARPDIEAIFPTYPSANVGAWGYLLLTSMLPHVPNSQLFGGQGPLTLYAFATDLEGHLTQLGRTQVDTTPTQITMENDTITKPFGAIDTPGQGQTIAGTVVNFGWALTPDSNTAADAGDIVVPPDGSTTLVYIDGAPVGNVSYNQCRGLATSGPVPGGVFCDDDVANIFGNPTPQAPFTTRTENVTRHRNLDAGRGAIGAYILDTTTLTNGLHTIMWGVTDSEGRGDGIGSRFITVLNGSSLTAQSRTANALATAATTVLGQADALSAWPVGAGTVLARHGISPATPLEVIEPDATGQRAVRMPAQSRLEVWLGDGVTGGYLVANETLRALPPGSRLDPATGMFTWHPMLGYLGTYQLTFLRANGTQVPLAVTLDAPASSEGSLAMALDRPGEAATITGAFTVEGWALDTGAWQGAGIGAVHVWAQRVDVAAAAPEFLGAATLNGGRADVAAIYGTQFDRTGWALSVAGLPPGTYDVTAYVWRTSTQQFEDARTTRISVR